MIEGDAVEVLVEICRETPLSIGIFTVHHSVAIIGERHPLIWLPRAEITAIKPGADGHAAITIPRWLAKAEGLLSETTEDPNQGKLL